MESISQIFIAFFFFFYLHACVAMQDLSVKKTMYRFIKKIISLINPQQMCDGVCICRVLALLLVFSYYFAVFE